MAEPLSKVDSAVAGLSISPKDKAPVDAKEDSKKPAKKTNSDVMNITDLGMYHSLFFLRKPPAVGSIDR